MISSVVWGKKIPIQFTNEHLVSFWPSIKIVALAEDGDDTRLEEPLSPLAGL